jgi:two-component system sensor histidine kinase and response regulator WspE
VEAQEGRLRLSSAHIDALLQGADMLLRLGAPPDGDVGWANNAGRADIDALVARLQGLLDPRAGSAPAPPGEPAAERAEPAPVEEPEPEAEHVVASREVRTRVLRVSAERLDHLLDISSKSLVEFQRIKPLGASLQRLKRLQASASRALDGAREVLLDASVDAQALTLLGEARQLLGECQAMLGQHMDELDDFGWLGGQRAQLMYDAALSSRMRPFADVLVGQERMLRDLARSLGKQVRLEVEGEATQVDRDVLEGLEAPLTHLLRNAVDHGIEAPVQRLLAGKPEEGRIVLRARHHAGMLLLELADDGAGVDLEQLRQSVLARQLATPETAAQLGEDELLAFLFLPGFSLRDTVTEVSGRGVGLDAVQHMLRQLRGNVRMEQRQGEGTRFFLEVPLTLSVVRSLVVQIGGEAYAFPLAHIERMTRLQSADMVQLEGRQHFWHEGRHVGLFSASQILQRAEDKSDEKGIPVVLIRERDSLYGIAVERFIGERTLVVMPLDPRLGKVQDVSAGALLDDGTPVLILDVEDMLNSVGKLLGSGRLERVDRSARLAGGVPRKRVLVVDDSLTVRELERKLLLGRGYQVAVAVDGMDGWNALRSEHFDLLITDIDMPRMDGIELVGLVRRDARLQALPVMVVSYKDREEDRRRGLDAGADYYLAKASFHDEALLDAVADLIGEAQG